MPRNTSMEEAAKRKGRRKANGTALEARFLVLVRREESSVCIDHAAQILHSGDDGRKVSPECGRSTLDEAQRSRGHHTPRGDAGSAFGLAEVRVRLELAICFLTWEK